MAGVGVVVALVGVVVVVAFALGILTLRILLATIGTLTILLHVYVNLLQSLHEVSLGGLARVVGYRDSLGGHIHHNILNALFEGDNVKHLLGATLAIKVGGESYGCSLFSPLSSPVHTRHQFRGRG